MEFFCLCCGNFVFLLEDRNENEKFRHQRWKMSTPETKHVHTWDEIFPRQFGKFSSMKDRACLVEPSRHLPYISRELKSQGSKAAVVSSSFSPHQKLNISTPETKYFHTRKGMIHFQTIGNNRSETWLSGHLFGFRSYISFLVWKLFITFGTVCRPG